jgi:hypothetical protein
MPRVAQNLRPLGARVCTCGSSSHVHHLALVPVFYAIFVLDLKWIKWQTTEHQQ